MSATNNIPNNVIINQEGDTVVYVTQDVPSNVQVYEDTPNRVTVNDEEPNRIVLALGGSISTGNLTKRHNHTQTSPSTTWTITHALGGKPQVTVVDTGDNVVHGDVQYLSNTQIVCSFSSAFAGYAYLT